MQIGQPRQTRARLAQSEVCPLCAALVLYVQSRSYGLPVWAPNSDFYERIRSLLSGTYKTGAHNSDPLRDGKGPYEGPEEISWTTGSRSQELNEGFADSQTATIPDTETIDTISLYIYI